MKRLFEVEYLNRYSGIQIFRERQSKTVFYTYLQSLIKQKSPDRNKSIRGFPFCPQDLSLYPLATEIYHELTGRSSDFPAFLTTFPSRGTVATRGQKGSHSYFERAGSQRRARPGFTPGSLLSSIEHLKILSLSNPNRAEGQASAGVHPPLSG